MFCKYCGKQIAEDVKFCPECGKSLKMSSTEDGCDKNSGASPISSKAPKTTGEVSYVNSQMYNKDYTPEPAYIKPKTKGKGCIIGCGSALGGVVLIFIICLIVILFSGK